MKYSITVVSGYNLDTRPSIILQFNSGRYLFNCGEGAQRICTEKSIRISKLKACFITRTRWECIGGVLGLLFTVSDASQQRIRLLGPLGITRFLCSSRYFLYRPRFELSVDEISGNESECVFKDENLAVSVVKLLPDECTDQDVQLDQNLDAYKHVLAGMFPVEGAGSYGYRIRKAPIPELPPIESHPSLAYICQGPDVPGKFHAKKAMELGVKPGPAFGALVRGESVVSSNGSVVMPSQCVGPSRLGSIMLILDIPDITYVSALVGNATLNKICSDALNPPKYMILFLGDKVANDSRLVNWVNFISPKTQIIVSSKNHGLKEHVFNTAEQIMARLSSIDQCIFPRHHKQEDAMPISEIFVDSGKQVQDMLPSQTYQVEPIALTEHSACTAVNLPVPSLESLVLSQEPKPVLNPVYNDTRIIPLGTGSSFPGKHRNVSSTLVSIHSNLYMMDVGEGTLGQMNRFYGPEAIGAALASLRMIIVSHIHADHHLGVFSVLQAWKKAVEGTVSRLTIVAPSLVTSWIREYATIEDVALDRVDFIDAESCRNGIAVDIPGLKKIITVPVVHCEKAFAAGFESISGFNWAFSGDCRPSDKFALTCKDVDLLIHEATFDDNMHSSAVQKRHSTVSEAIGIGKKMCAKNLLLTHFSQRYAKWAPEISNSGIPIGLAYDLMSIRMSDFWKLQSYAAMANKILEEMSDNSAETHSVYMDTSQISQKRLKKRKVE